MLGGRKNRNNRIGSPAHTVTYDGSPTKASKWIKADCSEYVNNLSAKKENYTTALDLYRACYENQLPQKCLKHLNFITLYCTDERKLLCVNCLYGSTQHKTHSVNPSNSSQPAIKRDNEENIAVMEEEMKNLKETEAQLQENKKTLETSQKYIFQEIDREFSEMYRMLDEKHRQVSERAKIEFDTALGENRFAGKEVGEWRQKMQDIRGMLPRESNNEEAEVYKHLVMELVLTEPLEGEKMTYMASREDMEDEFLGEVRELKETIRYKVGGEGEKASRRLF